MCGNKKNGRILGLLAMFSVLISMCVIGLFSVGAIAADAVAVTAAAVPPVSEAIVDPPRINSMVTPDSGLLPVHLTAPPGVPPGSVYVLDDGKIVTEKPLVPGASPSIAAPDKDIDAQAVSAVVEAQFTVIPNRIVVVNSDDEIIEIWNNTCLEDICYCLNIKEQDSHGLEHSLTPHILDIYNKLLHKIDWSVQGMVFPF